MLHRIIALTIKEILSLLKDKKSRFTIVIPPIVQLLVFGYAATYDLNDVPFAVYDEDRSAASRDLIARFAGSPNFTLTDRIDHQGEIADLVDRKAVLLVVHIGPNFSRDLLTGGGGQLQAILDGRNSNTAMIALNYVRDIVTRFNEDWLAKTGGRSPPARLNIPGLVQRQSGKSVVHRPRHRGLADPGGHHAGDGPVRGPGAGTGHLRPAPGHAPSAGGDPGGQGPPRLHHRLGRGHHHHPHRRLLVRGAAAGQPGGPLHRPVSCF